MVLKGAGGVAERSEARFFGGKVGHFRDFAEKKLDILLGEKMSQGMVEKDLFAFVRIVKMSVLDFFDL